LAVYETMNELLLEGLRRLNIALSSVTVLTAFSLLAYLFFNNVRNVVARTFVMVLALLTVVFVGDVFLATAKLPAGHIATGFWLRFQWLGIALIAPAYLHFSHALLATTGDASARRGWAVALSYGAGLVALASVLAGAPWVAGRVVGAPGAVRLDPGMLFPAFAAGYFGLVAVGAHNVVRARGRTLTRRSHRRMTYLVVSVIAPLSTFPWLIAGGDGLAERTLAFRAISVLANAAVAAMLVAVAYGVAYHGSLTPERNVRRELIKYLIQAPLLGIFVILTAVLVPERLNAHLGLPRDVVLLLTMAFGIVVYQFLVRLAKPLVDHLVYGPSGRDAMWLRRLDERLLTHQDIEQLLENILAALCDRLRVANGCVVLLQGDRLDRSAVEVYAGDRARAMALIAALDPAALSAGEDGAGLDDAPTGRLGARARGAGGFLSVDGFWVHPLRPRGGAAMLGFLAVERPARELSADEATAVAALLDGAEEALEDRVIQQRVIGALRDLEPALEDIQRLRGALEYGGEALATIDAGLVDSPDFPHWVRDALSHYWGGPKLADSPLLRLNIVREALETHDYNTSRAVRAVLDQALERLRPDGERSMTASQWMVYNILELKFVRGLRVRDIAGRLAMSESDLYRKQRVAIEALARQISAMETRPGDEGRG